MSALEKRRAEVPEEVRQFLRLPGLGPKTAARIWRELGVTTLDELREAAEQQRVRTLQGLGAKSEERILEALAKGFGAGAGAAGAARRRACRSSARSWRSSARTLRRSRSPAPGAFAGAARPSATST